MLHGNATLYFKNYTKNGLSTPTDTAGQNAGGTPPDWRFTATLSYSLDPITASLTGRAVSAGVYNNSWITCTTGCPTSTIDNQTINDNHIAGAFYMDASFAYKFALGEDASAEAFFNVRNIANRDPAQVGYTVPYLNAVTNYSLYDGLGRVFRAGVRFKM